VLQCGKKGLVTLHRNETEEVREMAMNIDLDAVMRPAEAALTNVEQTLDRTADTIGQAGYLPVGMRDGVMACVAAGKANVDGARQMKQGVADYAKASIEANINATKASLTARSLDDAMAVQREHLMAAMNDGLAQGSKLADLALAVSQKAAAPLRQQMEGPWAVWFKAAA
jgi:hypothetical protein